MRGASVTHFVTRSIEAGGPNWLWAELIWRTGLKFYEPPFNQWTSRTHHNLRYGVGR